MALRKFRASKAFTLIMVYVAIFVDMMVANLVAPVLPFALSDIIGLEESQVQMWNSILIAVYGASLTVGSVLIGLIGDRVRNKRTPFLWGLVILALTTLGLAVGRSLPVLVIARTLQGLSSAIVFGIGLAILQEVMGKDRMGSVSGFTGLVEGLGLQVGPVLGGLLYEYAGYFEVFLPAFGLLVVDVVLRLLWLPNKEHTPPPTINAGAENASDTREPQTDLFQNNSQEPRDPEADTEREPLLRPGTPKSLSSPKSHRRSSTPSIFILLSRPRFLTILLADLHVSALLSSLDATMPVYLMEAFHQSAADTVPFFMVLCAPVFLAPLIGIMVDRTGPKAPATLTFAMFAAGSFGMAFITPALGPWRPIMLALLAFLGVGMTFGFPALTADIGHAVAAIEEGDPGIFGPGGAYTQAYGLMNAFTSFGSVLGPLFAGFMKDYFGWGWTMISLGIISIAIGLLAVFFVGGTLACGRRQRGVGGVQK